ncbi:hypothetical protein SynPROSU1_02319 [Synechococcus sp. PROS-U-1]|nr:hypothetical protein SynPROSU1_02319 [Synechococcus sp. PROS-U-1]
MESNCLRNQKDNNCLFQPTTSTNPKPQSSKTDQRPWEHKPGQ